MTAETNKTNDSDQAMQEVPGRDYYQQNYPNYRIQTSRRKLDFYMKILNRWLKPGASVFELGVGCGDFLVQARSRYQVSGCDINPYGLQCARGKLAGVPLFLGSCQTLPQDGSLAAVLAWDVLEHLENLPEALERIKKALSGEGLLIGIVPVYDGPLGWLVCRLDHDLTHLSKWGRGQWADLLTGHGYRILETGGVIRKLVLNRWYLHWTWPRGLMRRIGSAFYFVACKAEFQPIHKHKEIRQNRTDV
jgi:SAM-dependent methyltransferase